jgi:DNA-binding NarL/FixJ family response regulator
VIRVLVVDDDAMVRTLLTTILTAQEIEVVGHATDGDEVVAAVHAHHPDVVLMDLHMARVSGLDAIAALGALPTPPGVIALTSFGTDDTVLAAVRAGASGFLAKDAGPDVIAGAVRKVAAGDGALDHAAAGSLTRHVATDPDRGRREEALQALAVLTEAEREVAAYVPAGLSNEAIGELTYRSSSTVKAHLSRAMAKLGMTSRSQLAVLVDRAGLAAPGTGT